MLDLELGHDLCQKNVQENDNSWRNPLLDFLKEKTTLSISKNAVKVKSSYFIQLSFILLPGAFMNEKIYVQQSANVRYNH